MPHMYELTQQMEGLQALIETGEMDAEMLQDTLDGLNTDLMDKGQDVLHFLANLAGDISAFDVEIKRMAARKKSLQNNHDWLKEYLRTNMIANGITKIECPVFTATLKKPGKKVDVFSENDLPTEYQTLVPASWNINRVQISKDLKAGIEIPGAKLVDAKQPLTIK